MKAAILYQYGESPKYAEVPDPIPNTGEALVTMVASSIKQLDKSKAAGKHYTKYQALPAIVGMDGIAQLADGTHVYITGIDGTMAEKAMIVPNSGIPVPEKLSIPLAAALPNALLGSDAAMLYRGGLTKGDTILINGATGATGRIAIQMARNRGAKCVIAVGRLSSGLDELTALGADILIDTQQDDNAFTEALTEVFQQHQPNVVIDYLWGHPAELILKALHGVITNKVNYITVGEMAGATIQLPSTLLRSRKIELLGSGIGSISYKEIKEYFTTELPTAYQWAAEGKIIMPLETVPLSDIETAWQTPEKQGKRNVVML